MSISNEQFEQAMQAVNLQIQTLDRALNARIALAEAEVLRLRSLRVSGTQQAKSGIMDGRNIYPADLKDMGRWRQWTERVLRWARMQSVDFHAALLAALKSPPFRCLMTAATSQSSSVPTWTTGSKSLRRRGS